MQLIYCDLYKNDLKKVLQVNDLSLLFEKKFLITGGLGLIGSAVVDLLLEFGKTKKIIVAGRRRDMFDARYGGVQGVEFIEYDALQPFNLTCEVDYIIHSAGVANPALYVSNPVETILSNFLGAYELLNYSKNTSLKRFVYISSSEIYGKKEKIEPYQEQDYGYINLDDIRSSYPIGKRSTEMLCRAYAREYNLETIIVRPGHIYGPTASRTDKRIATDFTFKAADGNILQMKSSGLQKRSYCYSVDCAAQILVALLYGESGQAYNIGHDEIISIRDMAKICAKVGNVELSIVEASENEQQSFNPMNNSSLNNDKVKMLGYKDSFSVEEGLTHTIRIIKECNL